MTDDLQKTAGSRAVSGIPIQKYRSLGDAWWVGQVTGLVTPMYEPFLLCGRTFLIVKSLGQSIEETIDYIEENILGKFRCFSPRAQEIYEEKERFASEFIADLKKYL